MHPRIRLAALVAAMFAAPALAQQAQAVRIEAQELSAALRSLAGQAGIQLLFDADELKGARTAGVAGTLTAEEALRRLLDGSRYGFKATGAGTYVVRRLPKADASRADTVLTEVVVTAATRTPQPLARVPASVSVVTQDDFDEVQAATASQVMKKLPNVEFGGGPRLNGEIPAIRGVFGPSITLLIDGARQNDATSPGIKSPLFIDPYFLRQAEVLRGPASSLYGAGGNGGVMSFTTLTAHDLLAPGAGFGGGVKLGYGSADKSARLNARVYGGNDTVDGLVALGSQDWNKIRQGGGSYLDPNDGKADTGMLKFGVKPTATSRIELTHQFYRSDNLQVNNPQATDYRTANLPVDKPAIQMTHVGQENTVLKGTLDGTDGAPALTATLYRTTLQYEADKSPNPAITNVLYSNTKTDTDGASFQGSRAFAAGSTQHRVTAGVDYFKDRQTAVAATAANPSAPSTVTRNGSRRATGLFVQDEIGLGGGWSLTPSLRSDSYDAAVADGSLAANSASRSSPKLALAWQDGGLMLYGNLGEAFRAPTVVELYQNLPCNAFVLNCFQPNAALRPEVDRTQEIGANYQRKSAFAEGDTLKVRAAWFDSKVTDLIYSTSLGARSAAPADVANCANTGLNCNYQFRNVPNARRSGGEIEAGYALDRWRLNAGYSRVRVENAGNGDRLFSPPDKLALQIRRQLPAQDLAVLWTATGVAAQDYDSTVLRRRAGYATHDLFVSWMPAAWKVKIDAGISNLFDKRYVAYQSANAYAYTFQEGRSLKLALSADF